MLYLTCHNLQRRYINNLATGVFVYACQKGPVNLQFIMILFANIYCEMLKNTREKVFWYVFWFLTNDIKTYGRAMLHIRGTSGIRLLITTVKLLNWMGKMQLTIPTGQQLTYNWDGMIVCLIYVSLLFCYTESFDLPFEFNPCSFQKAEEDCNKAISLDKKVTGQIFAMIFIIDCILVAIYHIRTNQLLWCSLYILV